MFKKGDIVKRYYETLTDKLLILEVTEDQWQERDFTAVVLKCVNNTGHYVGKTSDDWNYRVFKKFNSYNSSIKSGDLVYKTNTDELIIAIMLDNDKFAIIKSSDSQYPIGYSFPFDTDFEKFEGKIKIFKNGTS